MKKTLFFAVCLLMSNYIFSYDVSHTITSNGVSRTFIVHYNNAVIPSNKPVVIMLHGDGGTGAGIQSYCGMDAIANTNSFITVYPNSLNDLGNGIWNKPVNNNLNDGPNDVLFISDLIDFLCSTYFINNNKVYVAGHSGGGFMAYHLAVALPNKIAAFAPYAASMYGDNTYINNYFASATAVKVPLMHCHGSSDSVVDYPDTDNTPVAWGEWPITPFSYLNCGADTYTNTTDLGNSYYLIEFCNTSEASKQVSLLKRLGGGHGWPTGGGLESLMWNFFNQFELNLSPNCASLNTNDFEAKSKISVYPNPSNGIFAIETNHTINSVTAFDVLGKEISVKTIANNQFSIEQSGIYFLKIELENGSKLSQKISIK
jgi:poly(3-hydroxybutyrate) depolymerase